MSIATEISRLQTAKSNLKTSIENKGVTVPSATTLDGYAALVDQISGGVITTEIANATGTTLQITAGAPSGTVSITENGTYDVTSYASADADVSGGGSVVTRGVSFTNNDATAMYYTDATMAPQSITSGSKDLNNVQIPVGSLVVYVREDRAPPTPFPPTQSGVSQLANYTVGSNGKVTIYQVLPAPQGYTVEVSLTNPAHAEHFSHCTIDTALSNDLRGDSGEVLGQIDSPSSSTTVTVPPSAYGIIVNVDGVSTSLGTTSATGGVTYITDDGYGATLFQVTGDGTATLDGIDYDD